VDGDSHRRRHVRRDGRTEPRSPTPDAGTPSRRRRSDPVRAGVASGGCVTGSGWAGPSWLCAGPPRLRHP